MGKFDYLKGRKIGKLTVIKESGKDKYGKTLFECNCECGNTTQITGSDLSRGHKKSCGCMSAVHDLVGKKYGRLTVIAQSGRNKRNRIQWLCRCECGTEKVVVGDELRRGKVLSCGCYRDEKLSKLSYRHGGYGTRLYKCWQGIIQRCTCTTHQSYENYGGRGITVCDEWRDFANFKEWALVNGYKEDLTIDRKDNDGNYEPSNCRWATYETQENNTRQNVFLEFNGETKTVAQWAHEYGFSRDTVANRLRLGWNIEESLLTPIRGKRHRK
jgi:hypothetical protein